MSDFEISYSTMLFLKNLTIVPAVSFAWRSYKIVAYIDVQALFLAIFENEQADRIDLRLHLQYCYGYPLSVFWTLISLSVYAQLFDQ